MKKISLMKSKKFAKYVKIEFNTDENHKNAFKLYHDVRDHCHYTGKFRGAAHSICNLRHKTPIECLGENTEKYIIFSVPISKELDNGKTITYKLKFIGSFRFMSTSLSKPVNNLSEIYKK